MKTSNISITLLLVLISTSLVAQIRLGGNLGVTAIESNNLHNTMGATLLFPAGKNFNYGFDFTFHNLEYANLVSLTTNATFIFGDHKYHIHPVLGFALGIHRFYNQRYGNDIYDHSNSPRYGGAINTGIAIKIIERVELMLQCKLNLLDYYTTFVNVCAGVNFKIHTASDDRNNSSKTPKHRLN